MMFRFVCRLDALTVDERRSLLERSTTGDTAIRSVVATILERVRVGGDRAVRALAHEIDDVRLESLEVPRAACDAALATLDARVRGALERAARNIRRVHEAMRPSAMEVESEKGVIVGRRPHPLDRVGIYAPGGRAAYPSSLLMSAIPARIAGVPELVVCTPPAADGTPSPIVLAAAALAGVDRVFAIGGAHAVAAMAFGTESVPRVDRIVGPGNAYVAEAKVQVSGIVGIDLPAGPSELLVVADESADAAVVTHELLAQAEHDPRAGVLAIVTDAGLSARILEASAAAIASAPRRDIIMDALAARGGVLIAESVEEALRFADDYAPEHLLLAVRDPDALLPRVRNAGAVFLGEQSSVAFGDYLTGANHVLPTGGAARCFSGLSTEDFFRWTWYQRVSRDAATRLADDTATLAMAEGLPAHARAAMMGAEALPC